MIASMRYAALMSRLPEAVVVRKECVPLRWCPPADAFLGIGYLETANIIDSACHRVAG
jgi:hypothetical protein